MSLARIATVSIRHFHSSPFLDAERCAPGQSFGNCYLAGFDVPFVLLDVQLDDQPSVRMIGRLMDGPEAPLHIGDAVIVDFEDLAPGVAVPAFRLAAAS